MGFGRQDKTRCRLASTRECVLARLDWDSQKNTDFRKDAKWQDARSRWSGVHLTLGLLKLLAFGIGLLCYCYGLNICVPPRLVHWNPIPNVTVWSDGDFGKWWGHEGGAFMNEISALIKGTPQSPAAPSTMWGHSGKPAVCNPNEDLHQSSTMLTSREEKSRW